MLEITVTDTAVMYRLGDLMAALGIADLDELDPDAADDILVASGAPEWVRGTGGMVVGGWETRTRVEGGTMGRTFERFRQANIDRDRDVYNDQDWSLNDWGVALAGEVGEACNLLKKLRRGEPIDPKEIAFEIADAVVYADVLLTHLGFRLEDVTVEKFNIVSRRVESTVTLGGEPA